MLIGILAGLGAGFFWGFSFLVPQLLTGFTPAQVALGRFAYFGIISLAVIASNPRALRRWVTPRALGMALLLSLTGYSFYYLVLTYSIRESGIPLSSLIIGLLPLTIAVCSRSRPARPRLFTASLVLIALGIAVLNGEAIWMLGSESGAVPSWRGPLAAVVSLMSWTWFAVANSRYLQTHREIDNVGWTNLLGAFSFFGMLVFAAAEPMVTGSSQGGLVALFAHPDLSTFLVWTGVLGIGSTYFATWLWNKASALLPTSLTGQLIVSETVFALLFAFLHEQRFPTAAESISMASLITGVLLGIYSFKPRKNIR
jgi:drug/metabolite transporter (DMT)-like permease